MKIEILDVQPIQLPGMDYVGWPTLARLPSGELLAVYSGGRQRHACPYGQLHLLRSQDQGRTWQGPEVLADGPLDDRDGGLLVTSRGTVIANWFTSLAWEMYFIRSPERFQTIAPQHRDAWLQRHASLTPDIRQQELGIWAIRSTDGGRTWSPRIDSVTGSPHGPFELTTGRLMHAGKFKIHHHTASTNGSPYAAKLGVAISDDDGQSWQAFSEIAPMPGHTVDNYHELHGVEAADGRIVVHIRNHNETFFHQTLQTESHDGGRTWSQVHPTGIMGFPAFLLRMHDGRIMSTVANREDPKTVLAVVSDDHGDTWSEPLFIARNAGGDMGYPSTIEVEPGQFMTLWYDNPKQEPHTHLRWARWRLV